MEMISLGSLNPHQGATFNVGGEEILAIRVHGGFLYRALAAKDTPFVFAPLVTSSMSTLVTPLSSETPKNPAKKASKPKASTDTRDLL